MVGFLSEIRNEECGYTDSVSVEGISANFNDILLKINTGSEILDYDIFNVSTEDVIKITKYLLYIKDEL